MSGYRFTPAERYAIYTVHGATCYLNGEPLYLKTMWVDHVLPRSLAADPKRLLECLREYNLPADFRLDSYENWLPACGPCNNAKGKDPFRPTPILQRHLDRAISKAAKVKALAESVLSDQAISKALNMIEQALSARQIDVSVLEPLFSQYVREAGLEQKEAPLELRVDPSWKVVCNAGTYRIVSTQWGAGYVPNGESVDTSFYCGNCGSLGPWNGARCMTCGHLIQDD
jgi:5-methylcytosine-specific restriction endonuclease McrA